MAWWLFRRRFPESAIQLAAGKQTRILLCPLSLGPGQQLCDNLGVGRGDIGVLVPGGHTGSKAATDGAKVNKCERRKR